MGLYPNVGESSWLLASYSTYPKFVSRLAYNLKIGHEHSLLHPFQLFSYSQSTIRCYINYTLHQYYVEHCVLSENIWYDVSGSGSTLNLWLVVLYRRTYYIYHMNSGDDWDRTRDLFLNILLTTRPLEPLVC